MTNFIRQIALLGWTSWVVCSFPSYAQDTPTYTKADVEKAAQEAYNEGYDRGYSIGYDKGKKTGGGGSSDRPELSSDNQIITLSSVIGAIESGGVLVGGQGGGGSNSDSRVPYEEFLSRLTIANELEGIGFEALSQAVLDGKNVTLEGYKFSESGISYGTKIISTDDISEADETILISPATAVTATSTNGHKLDVERVNEILSLQSRGLSNGLIITQITVEDQP